MHWRTAVTRNCLYSYPDSASVKAATVPSSLFGSELINIPLRQDIVNSLVNCVLFVEFIGSEKLLTCVEVWITLAVALSMQHSLYTLQQLPLHLVSMLDCLFHSLEIQLAHVSRARVLTSARNRGL